MGKAEGRHLVFIKITSRTSQTSVEHGLLGLICPYFRVVDVEVSVQCCRKRLAIDNDLHRTFN